MRVRHATALALVGWYLLVPPRSPSWFSRKSVPRRNAPLSEWRILKSFDEARSCERERAFDDDPDERCIAAEDPRLRGEKMASLGSELWQSESPIHSLRVVHVQYARAE